jgi:excalibur calcium-binding domain-containing protein
MRHPRTTLLGLAAGGALALSAALVAPAYAGTTTPGPNSSECINAKIVLSNAQTAQAAAQAAYNTAVKNRDDALDVYNAALADSDPTNDATALAKLNNAKDALLTANLLLNERIKAVTAAQVKVDAACTTPTPTTTPTPVGIPAQFTDCAQAAKWGYHDIPSTSRYYRLSLDRDKDGCACEIKEGPAPVAIGPSTTTTVVVPPPTGNTTIVNPPAAPKAPDTVVIVPPAPSGSNFGQIGQAPSGAASTGFGPGA